MTFPLPIIISEGAFPSADSISVPESFHPGQVRPVGVDTAVTHPFIL